jgi:SAM-dependent methyltransferase
MCGTGLNLIPFLEAGADIDGLDASPFMLDICRQKCEASGMKCDLYEQLIEQMELPRHYGFIFIPGGSYGHVYDKTVAAEALRRMYAHLLPGGWLVLDVRTPAYMGHFPRTGEVDFDLDERPDGATILRTGVWEHLAEGRIIRHWNKYERFVNDILTETEVFDYRERMYELREMKDDFKAAGFEEIRITQAWQHDVDPTEHYELTFMCRKA